jgi:hypothetical protein
MTTLYRNNILRALRKHYEAQVDLHKINIDIMLDNIVGVAEHPDVIKTVDDEIGKISEWEEKLQILNKYF